jgi:ubiquinone/menaquinone biosynthesis C-methylase UbiE
VVVTPSELKTQRRDWDDVAGFNPEWGVLTARDAKFVGWDMDAFFQSGTSQIDQAMAAGGELGLPEAQGKVLDFGCGVGRLAPALSNRFERYVGVDISEGMIHRAKELHGGRDNCEFVVNEEAGLSRFEDREFDAIVSYLVLQHMPSRELIRDYLSEMARILAPAGLIAIQSLSHIPLINRLKVRRRLYVLARAVGVGADRAHRWGLQAMQLTAIPVEEVAESLTLHGCEVVRDETTPASQGILTTTYYATKPRP